MVSTTKSPGCECGRRAGPAGKCDRCSDRLGICRDCGCGLEQPDPEQIDWESVALDLGYQPSADMIAAVWGRAVASRLQWGLVVSWGGRDRRANVSTM